MQLKVVAFCLLVAYIFENILEMLTYPVIGLESVSASEDVIGDLMSPSAVINV